MFFVDDTTQTEDLDAKIAWDIEFSYTARLSASIINVYLEIYDFNAVSEGI